MSIPIAGGRALPRISRLFTTPAPGVLPVFGRTAPMVVFRAPRGWGKTTTAAAWLRSLGDGHTFDWLTLTRETAEPEFTALLSASTKRLCGAAGTHRPLTPDGRAEHRWLVVDNLHLVTSPSVDDALVDLATSDEYLHVLVTSESERPIETLAEVEADGLVCRAPELRLTGAEVQTMARALGITMGPETAWHFANEVLGWPALVRCLLLAHDDSWPLSADARERVCEYVEILARGSAADSTIHDAMRIALASRPDGEIMRLLIGHDAGPTNELRRLRSDGFLGPDGHLTRTVRDALSDALAETDPHAFRQLHSALAHWYERHGSIGRSLEHAARAGDEAHCRALLRGSWLEVTAHDGPARRALAVADRSDPDGDTRLELLRARLQPEGGPRPASRPSVESTRIELEWIVARLGAMDSPSSVAGMTRQATAHADLLGDAALSDRAAATAALTYAAYGATADARRWLAGSSAPEADALRRAASLLIARDTLAVDPHPPADSTDPTDPTDPTGVMSVAALSDGPGGSDRSDMSDMSADWLALLDAPVSAGLPRAQSTGAPSRGARVVALQRHLASIPRRESFSLVTVETLATLAAALIADQQFARCHEVLTEVMPTHPALRTARARLSLCLGDARDALVLTEHRPGGEPEPTPRDNVTRALVRACALVRLDRSGEAAAELEHALLIARAHDLLHPFRLVPTADLARIVRSAPRLRELMWWGELDRLDTALTPTPPVPELSQSEQRALTLLAEGMPLAAAASRMFISTNTVKSQLRSAYRKLGVHNRAEAVARARELLLIPPRPRPGADSVELLDGIDRRAG
ncbi:hypothetical protein GCG21_00435 [Pseudactinotalea sp. HY160]|uniref:helix-turn-helix transcriptional regulator n=1 Tax=Pseudactinotalea sp. HY160 TaxID=2654490 RepID=UPI00128E3D73|nr:LuxR C-terminal-related transcriptional regulator [Pseudactinotalea sp. HY160]MPV48500.1 hypothetical protein [Pseudactinotalea sp. HY160]